ncbi:MAG: hypothetical protein IPJ20_25790 [Flammeovirgaceae bacterium]|nr:hypothetical protein [Flammeovirgaceae bacterium]
MTTTRQVIDKKEVEEEGEGLEDQAGRFLKVFFLNHGKAILCRSYFVKCYSPFEFAFSQVDVANDSSAVKQKTVREHKVLKAFAAPVVLTTVGLLAKTNNFFLSDQKVYQKRNESYPNFHTHADNYLQYVPIVAVYGLNAAGVKGKNSFGNRTAILIKSEPIMTILYLFTKRNYSCDPPRHRDANIISFGHTVRHCSGHVYGERVWAREGVV